MKKSILTLTIVTLTTLSIFAGNIKNLNDYVVTEEGILYVEKVKLGIDNTVTAKLVNGETIIFKSEDVKAYRKKGKVFKRMYKVAEGSTFVNRIFVQKLHSRAGYDLYRHGKDFYVYYNDVQELKVNRENYKVVLSFFFPKFNLKYSK